MHRSPREALIRSNSRDFSLPPTYSPNTTEDRKGEGKTEGEGGDRMDRKDIGGRRGGMAKRIEGKRGQEVNGRAVALSFNS